MMGVNSIVKVFLFRSNSTYMTPSIIACETEKAFDDAGNSKVWTSWNNYNVFNFK